MDPRQKRNIAIYCNDQEFEILLLCYARAVALRGGDDETSKLLTETVIAAMSEHPSHTETLSHQIFSLVSGRDDTMTPTMWAG